ncbi:MAG TPA: flagellar motor stator protein MotA [Gemmatimonas aurantiaca]|uniref:Chemotaxis MotA protein n=2 Tax=Gemmatimonas aurantiaca TaxID=173480 RepID=C1A528_GEMAT|nr:flagellar motor stator protein MotA [Gemmatimonas aurantiaca]BAH37338.1 chemotaxis MotA protein [Gemmatimonas aurantiaca T-27]HCT55754.1 flagellar motor stator protein MotA [Gemmatimonas aurantiaca]
MFVIIGLVVVFGSVIGGYVMHHGQIAVLFQINEFIIIGGAGLGTLIIANPPAVLKACVAQTLGLLKPNPYGASAYAELLQVLYEVFQKARKDGLVGLEAHIEAPESSDIFQKYPSFTNNHHAVSLLCDTLKVLLTGTVEDHNLAEILDVDLEKHHHEGMLAPHAITTVGDAMPGFGIVAAVLGVIITMGSIGGAASEIGEKVAAALVGTFVGILLAYGVFGPVAKAMENRLHAEHDYMLCIRTALLSFARGDAPMTAVEFSRRNIEPHERPSFTELEELTRKKAA